MTTTTSAPTTAEIDETAVEELAGRIFEMVSGASAMLMVSVGHQVGLFDTMAVLEPSTRVRGSTAPRPWSATPWPTSRPSRFRH